MPSPDLSPSRKSSPSSAAPRVDLLEGTNGLTSSQDHYIQQLERRISALERKLIESPETAPAQAADSEGNSSPLHGTSVVPKPKAHRSFPGNDRKNYSRQVHVRVSAPSSAARGFTASKRIARSAPARPPLPERPVTGKPQIQPLIRRDPQLLRILKRLGAICTTSMVRNTRFT